MKVICIKDYIYGNTFENGFISFKQGDIIEVKTVNFDSYMTWFICLKTNLYLTRDNFIPIEEYREQQLNSILV